VKDTCDSNTRPGAFPLVRFGFQVVKSKTLSQLANGKVKLC